MKKQLKEWGIIIGVFSLLYLTGLHTEVAGFLQRVILSTGLIEAKEFPPSKQQIASYDFYLKDEKDQLISFEKFRGKMVFLNFWATWCPPCIAEMPDIHDLYLKVGTEDIVFVMISQDENFEKAKNFIERKEYTFPIYQLASALPDVYRSQSIPTTFVISPTGKILTKRVGMAKYDTETFRNLLYQNSAKVQL